MLSYLHVRNLAVVEEASVDFAEGLCVLTGETGAGKSLVIDSLSLLGGVRATSDLIRTGSETLTVTGVFRSPEGEAAPWHQMLAEVGLAGEGEHGGAADARRAECELVVRREVSRSGRNRVFVNDQPVTLGLLAAIAPFLLRIHGQRDELGLIAPEQQRALVDRQGGAEGERLLGAVAEAHRAYSELAQRLERLTGDERARHERVDLLRFQLREIDGASVQAGEELALREERDTLRYAEEIALALNDAVQLLSDADEGAAVSDLARARQAIAGIADWQSDAAAWLAELDELAVRAEELATTLRRRLSDIDADPARLDQVEDRLALLERLLRKYGPGSPSSRPSSTEELLRYREAIETELSELTWDEDKRGRLEADVEAALAVYRERALELSARRSEWAAGLAAAVEAQLPELALPNARFAARCGRRLASESALKIEGQGVQVSADGFDEITFDFSPNPGEELRALARVASGGELARVYLALQVAVSQGSSERRGVSLIFDEVDAGLGGAQAAIVGRKLRALAGSGQILAVTHLPQVASQGNVHFRVLKEVVGERTVVGVTRLDGEGRVEELARMLAGEEVTETARQNARELLEAREVVPSQEVEGARRGARGKRAS